MPAKGSTGTTRRPPLRSDRGVKLYAPTMAKPYFRVVAAGQVERTSAPVPLEHLAPSEAAKFAGRDLDSETARSRREADELFDQMVRWAKHQTSPTRRGERTINALCDRRLEDLSNKGRARSTIEKNESLMRLYVRPVIGHVEVADWSPEHSLAVLNRARESCGAERVADLGSLLRSLVTLAHRKPLWLSRDEDPMEGVEFRVRATRQGESVHYVPMKKRPSTEQVESLADAMQEVGCSAQAYHDGRPTTRVTVDREWGWLLTQTMGKAGPRFGEAIALTVTSVARPLAEVLSAIDEDLTLNPASRAARRAAIIDLPHGYALDPGRRLILITEAVEWEGSKPHIAPCERRASGKVPKSKKERWTIYPASLVEAMATRCADLLERFGPEQGPHALLFPAGDHCFVQVPRDPRRPSRGTRWQDQDWWNRSHFRKTMYRNAAAQAEGWPDTPEFPFENLRHHFATWAKRHGYPDELISHCMGHATVDYTQRRYFRTGADTIPDGMAASEGL
ncbi:MAG: site-specific integrase [Acidobacteriota bacterium]|nr:site-specific integrase [Acidobacteriota bacterium]